MGVSKRAVNLGISTAFYALAYLWNMLMRISGSSLRRRSVILYYHVVTPQDRARFAAQMDAVLRWAIPIRADIVGPMDTSVRHVAVTFDDASDTFRVNALPELEKRGIPCTIFAISGFLGRQITWDEYSDCIMSADELRNLDPALITVGSHTVSHPDLTSLTEPAARTELQRSRSQLETLLQRKVTLFSFPFGNFNDKAVELCREAGYVRVFTTLPSYTFETSAQFVCGRVRVDPSDWPLEFYLKVVGAYCWLPWAITLKRRLVGMVHTRQQSRSGTKAAANVDYTPKGI